MSMEDFFLGKLRLGREWDNTLDKHIVLLVEDRLRIGKYFQELNSLKGWGVYMQKILREFMSRKLKTSF